MPNVGMIEHISDTYTPKASTDMTRGQVAVLATTGAGEIQPAGTSSEYILGVLAADADAGASARVVEEGIVDAQVKDGETWAIGDPLKLAANGQLSNASVTTGVKYFAIAQQVVTSASSSLGRVKLLGKTPATAA